MIPLIGDLHTPIQGCYCRVQVKEMKRLYKGILKFQESYYKKERKFFRRLSNKQEPDVLFITCADARVYPTLVTQSKPGELFIVRNVGNIVPPYDSIRDKNSVAAALEFAVLKLKVSDIIVCGHSNCGAMQALAGDEHDAPPQRLAAYGSAGQRCSRYVLCREFRQVTSKSIGRGKRSYTAEKYTDLSLCIRGIGERATLPARLVL